MKILRRAAAVLTAVLLSAGLAGCGSGDEGKVGTGKTLVIGTTSFNGKFSPFFAETVYDREISDMCHVRLIRDDREGAPADNVAEYREPELKKAEDGTITESVYTFRIKEGARFSDGTPVTADDLIFTYKVYCDPHYDGSATVNTMPIVGLEEYRYDDPNYRERITSIEQKTAAHIPTDKEIQDTAAALAQQTGEQPSAYLSGGIHYETQTLPAARDAYYRSLESAYIEESLAAGGNRVPDIAGIRKVDDRTVTVTLRGLDPAAIWTLGDLVVAPAAYYGKGKDGKTFQKGDIALVKEKNGAPMGAGPYQFEKFENNVVSLKANDGYFRGKPHIERIKYQVVEDKNKVSGVIKGDYDIAQPSASVEVLGKVKDAGLHYALYDNLGYGYVGVNAERIPDINVRKGLLSLLNRGPAIETYYGKELATVIERPMSRVSWAYPEDAKAVYTYDEAAAKRYFEAAGYAQSTSGGKTVLQKDGKQLKVEIYVAELSTHPAGPILTNMKSAMDRLGAVLEIKDVESSILFDTINAGGADMWVAAWQATNDPDLFQIYHSSGPSNHYRIRNTELDRLIVEARQTNDRGARQQTYARALDIIMENAVEMPIYQRKNMYIFNPKTVDIATLPENMTAYYTWQDEIEKIKMK